MYVKMHESLSAGEQDTHKQTESEDVMNLSKNPILLPSTPDNPNASHLHV